MSESISNVCKNEKRTYRTKIRLKRALLNMID